MSDDYTAVNVPERWIMEKDAEITRLRDALAAVTAERDRMRAAFEKAANDMRPMLRSMISRNEAAEIVRRAARAALDGVTEPAPPWRDIESAPNDQIILVYDKSASTKIVAAFLSEGGWLYAEGFEAAPKVPIPSHWMPLPEPPND